MRRSIHSALGLPLFALAISILTPTPADAQRIASWSIGGGVVRYDLAETGTAPAATLRLEVPVTRTVLLEPGIMVAYPNQDVGRQWIVLPQAIVQYRLSPGASVEPYVGGGAGVALGFEDEGASEVDVLLTGALGARIGTASPIGFVIDARAHAIGFDADASLFELTLGLRFRR